MLRQISLMALLVFLLSALVALDFKAAQRAATNDQRALPSFPEHLLDLGHRLAGFFDFGTGGTGAEGSARLVRMLPLAPEGWTPRPTTAEDIQGFLARKERDNDPFATALIEGLLSGGPKGSEVAMQAFDRKDRLVVFKLIRHPDAPFTDPSRLAELDALVAATPTLEMQDFIRVRGLDVARVALPEKLRVQVFWAELGNQLELWVLASNRLEADDLIPFFNTLDVPAMNAAVLDQERGMGDVPVIILVSDLDEDSLAAYQADRRNRAAGRAARLAEIRAAMAARLAAPDAALPEAAPKEPGGCQTNASGVTICATPG